MITAILITLIGVLCFTRSSENKYSIMVFASLCWVFQVIGKYIPAEHGAFYYLGAGITDVLIIKLLCKVRKVTQLIIDIQTISLMFVFINLIGWVIFEEGYKSTLYDAACSSLFIVTIFVILDKGRKNELGITSDDCGGNFFRRSNHSGNFGL